MKHTAIVIAAIALFSFSSCQKVINVKLNSSSSQYVVTGNVSTESGPYHVKINKSIDFQLDNNFPAVSGALVAITDVTSGQSDTLTETAPGDYITSILTGQTGHTYELYIKTDGQVFTASSTIPAAVPLDSLYQQPAEFGEGVSIVPVYTDPAGVRNYYHFIKYIDSMRSKDLYYRSDLFADGKKISVPLNLGTDTAIHTGGYVTIEMENIDSAMYQYYRTLDETMSQNSASPANPATNISGVKLGYFSAHTTTRKTIHIY